MADLRLRAANFPSIAALFGRLVVGLLRPRHAVQGTMFAGRVVAVGRSVTRYAIGDDVFGSALHGAYAEYLSMGEGAAMAKKPARLSYDEAAAVPYGALTALRFLRDLGGVEPGEKVLVLGASGGVGRFGVQIAKHLGAEVTGVCSASNADLVRSLGADHVVDHRSEDFTRGGARYDVIFDAGGVSTFLRSRRALNRRGRYLTVLVSVGVLLQMAFTAVVGGRRAKFAIAMGDRSDLEQLRDLVEQGVLRPVVGRRFPLSRIVEAHAEAESGRVRGAVIVQSTAVSPPR